MVPIPADVAQSSTAAQMAMPGSALSRGGEKADATLSKDDPEAQ